MKHFFATLYFAVLATVFLPITARAANGLWVSLVAGVNASTLTYHGNDAPSNTTRQLGLLGGASSTVHFSDNVALRVEVLYSEKGETRERTNVQGVRAEYTTSLAYIDIPATAMILFSGKRIRPYFFTGPVLSTRVGTVRATINGEKQQVEDNAIEPLDIGITFGIGARLPIGWNAVEVDMRYTSGLTNTDNISTTPWERQHSVFSLTARYSFSL